MHEPPARARMRNTAYAGKASAAQPRPADEPPRWMGCLPPPALLTLGWWYRGAQRSHQQASARIMLRVPAANGSGTISESRAESYVASCRSLIYQQRFRGLNCEATGRATAVCRERRACRELKVTWTARHAFPAGGHLVRHLYNAPHRLSVI